MSSSMYSSRNDIRMFDLLSPGEDSGNRLRTLLERQEEPPMVSGTSCAWVPYVLLLSFVSLNGSFLSFFLILPFFLSLLVCYTQCHISMYVVCVRACVRVCVCAGGGVGFCCDPWAGGVAGSLQG